MQPKQELCPTGQNSVTPDDQESGGGGGGGGGECTKDLVSVAING